MIANGNDWRFLKLEGKKLTTSVDFFTHGPTVDERQQMLLDDYRATSSTDTRCSHYGHVQWVEAHHMVEASKHGDTLEKSPE